MTTELVRNCDLIVLEGLTIKHMPRAAKGTVENPGKNIIAAGLAVTERGGRSHVTSTKTQHSDPVKRTTNPKAA